MQIALNSETVTVKGPSTFSVLCLTRKMNLASNPRCVLVALKSAHLRILPCVSKMQAENKIKALADDRFRMRNQKRSQCELQMISVSINSG